MLMGVYITESVLRAVVCSKFATKALELFTSDQKLSKRFNVAYYIVMGILLFVVILLSYFAGSYSLNCEGDMFGMQWFIIGAIDIIQSILITMSSFYLIR
jgi:predicted nucleic acid-binding Zn ribbon protein